MWKVSKGKCRFSPDLSKSESMVRRKSICISSTSKWSALTSWSSRCEYSSSTLKSLGSCWEGGRGRVAASLIVVIRVVQLLPRNIVPAVPVAEGHADGAEVEAGRGHRGQGLVGLEVLALLPLLRPLLVVAPALEGLRLLVPKDLGVPPPAD